MAESTTFNNRMLEAMQPPQNADRRTEYRDNSEDGLYLFLTPHGRKTFYFYKKFRGRPIRMKIGRFPDLSVSAARAKVRELKGQLAIGVNPCRPVTASHKITLSRVVEQFFEQKANTLRPATVRIYRLTIDNHLAPWRNSPLATIDKDQVVRLHRKIANGSGAATADLAMRILRTLFEFFVDRHGFSGSNPAKTLSQNRLWATSAKDRRQTIISNNDLPAWFRCVIQWENSTESDYLLTLFVTGMRKNEAAGMLWEHVDFEQNTFTIPDTKNHRPLILPISRFLQELLRKRQQETRASRFVFPCARNPDKYLNASSLARRVSKYADIQFMLHDLRRTFATAAESLDISMETIKRLLNHKSGIDVTAGYIIHDTERLREPVERITQHLLNVAGHQPDR